MPRGLRRRRKILQRRFQPKTARLHPVGKEVAASDRRAIADHETLIALHEMAKQQLDILHGQDRMLSILDNFASQEMPARQREIQDTVDKVLAAVVKPA